MLQQPRSIAIEKLHHHFLGRHREHQDQRPDWVELIHREWALRVGDFAEYLAGFLPILIIDDDPDFVAIYRDMFEKQGLQVTVAHTADDGTRSLEQLGAELDVVLLDQKLQGRGGPDSGLELIIRAESLAPFAKTIVVTGYATAEAIERAFQLGVYDYLVKNGAFAALIRAKVRNAVEVT